MRSLLWPHVRPQLGALSAALGLALVMAGLSAAQPLLTRMAIDEGLIGRNFGRLVAASAPFTIGRITKSLGGNIEGFRTAGMCVSLVLLLGILVLPFLPETKGQPLPE